MSQKHIDWKSYYQAQVGGEFNYYRGSNYQEGFGYSYQIGDGLGDMFRRFASWVVPILKKHAIPTIQSGVKAIGREALDSAADVAKDLLSGKEFKESATNRYKTAVDSLRERAENKLEGRGIKRKNTSQKKVIFKKQKLTNTKYQDIFEN